MIVKLYDFLLLGILTAKPYITLMNKLKLKLCLIFVKLQQFGK